MKLFELLNKDWLYATLIAVTIFLAGFSQIQLPANDYYHVTALNWLENGTAFLRTYPEYFNELVPTEKGPVMVLPPFPILPSIIGRLLGLSEPSTTRLAIGISVAMMYLILRGLKQSKIVSLSGAGLYFLSTPLLYFFTERGYWFSAQVWGVVGAQIALLALLGKKYTLAGIGSGIALLSRINLGVMLTLGFALFIFKTYKMKALRNYLAPAMLAAGTLLWWNYYRFGSILISGYELIPGVLDEPWYSKGIMHPSYIWSNFQEFMWQSSLNGSGIGIVWMQPFLLLVPFIINRKNWWLIALATIQFITVLAHGYTGAQQFDFRFLMDSLWLFIPLLLIEKRRWWNLAIWICFVASAIVHVAYI